MIYEWGNQHRLIILGRVSAILPRPDAAIIRLNMDAVGILDFDAGTFALDAVLYDSRLCGRFVITGAMAMRMGLEGRRGFALAVGGLHPRFARAGGLPERRAPAARADHRRQPALICQAYFAITSNTVQFGADCSLYAAAFGFSVEGDVGFDVLIQLAAVPLPRRVPRQRAAQARLARNLFKVTVKGALEGPLPLRVAGKATFEILWCDFSVSFNATLVDGGDAERPRPRRRPRRCSSTRSSEPRAWQAALPADVAPARRACASRRPRACCCIRSAASACARRWCRSGSTATSTGSAPASPIGRAALRR